MDSVIFSLILIGCIFAVVEIVRQISHYILSSRKNISSITVMPVSGRMDDVEYVVRGLLWQKNWSELKNYGKIILLDLGADDETVRICQSFAEENELIEFFTPSELENYLKK